MKTLYLFIFGGLFVLGGSLMLDLTKLGSFAGSVCALGGILLFMALIAHWTNINES